MSPSADVIFTEDPEYVLCVAGDYLASDPLQHNLVLTLLRARVTHADAGRYWIATKGGAVVGLVLQAPLDFVATVTPMGTDLAATMVNAIAERGVVLPGVYGDAATAAAFAGQWAERHAVAVAPFQGTRLYRLFELQPSTTSAGSLRQAAPEHRDLVVRWVRAFFSDIGESFWDAEVLVDRRLPQGHFFLWDDGGPVSLAANTDPLAGVVRVQYVYTPPERRRCGYASACVAALSTRTQTAGHHCILYTDLGNSTSNRLYRRIGYRAVAEGVKYRFGGP
ncbi:MAG: GNAT family N-acetyltransferase [Myxococcota bacterium]|nr:GNAT family N-acetyltransferase [Myxococcota bacterium]